MCGLCRCPYFQVSTLISFTVQVIHISKINFVNAAMPKITFITFATVVGITDTFYYIGMHFFMRWIIVLVSKRYCTIIISFMLHHSVTFEV